MKFFLTLFLGALIGFTSPSFIFAQSDSNQAEGWRLKGGGQNSPIAETFHEYSNMSSYEEYCDVTPIFNLSSSISQLVDLAPQMQINPDEIKAEIESLEKCFNDLGVNDEKVIEARKDLETAKVSISTEVSEKDHAIQAAKIEIEEHNKHNQSLFSTKKTTDEEKARVKVIELEKMKEKWDTCAIKWRTRGQEIQERNSQKSLQFAKLSRVCELLSEEAYHAERIWNALKSKKGASNAKKQEFIELLDNATKFTKKVPFDRSEELFQQADNAWKQSKQLSHGKKVAQVADQATSVLQYVNILGIVSPAAITQMISLAANSMDKQVVATIVANNLEEVAIKYYAKMARIEADKTARDVQNSINRCQNKLNTLQEDKKSRAQKDLEVTEREIERAQVRLKAHEEVLRIFWSEENQQQIDEGDTLANIGEKIGKSSSSSSSSSYLSSDNASSNFNQNISVSTIQQINYNLKPINIAIEQQQNIEATTTQLAELTTTPPNTPPVTWMRQATAPTSLKTDLANRSIKAAQEAWERAKESAGKATNVFNHTIGHSFDEQMQLYYDLQGLHHRIDACNYPKTAWRAVAIDYQQALETAQAAQLSEATIKEVDTLCQEAEAEAAYWTAVVRYLELRCLQKTREKCFQLLKHCSHQFKKRWDAYHLETKVASPKEFNLALEKAKAACNDVRVIAIIDRLVTSRIPMPISISYLESLAPLEELEEPNEISNSIFEKYNLYSDLNESGTASSLEKPLLNTNKKSYWSRCTIL